MVIIDHISVLGWLRKGNAGGKERGKGAREGEGKAGVFNYHRPVQMF